MSMFFGTGAFILLILRKILLSETKTVHFPYQCKSNSPTTDQGPDAGCMAGKYSDVATVVVSSFSPVPFTVIIEAPASAVY